MKIYLAKREQVVFHETHVQLAEYIPVKIRFNTIQYTIGHTVCGAIHCSPNWLIEVALTPCAYPRKWPETLASYNNGVETATPIALAYEIQNNIYQPDPTLCLDSIPNRLGQDRRSQCYENDDVRAFCPPSSVSPYEIHRGTAPGILQLFPGCNLLQRSQVITQ